jgi:HK97 family phage prohead protease
MMNPPPLLGSIHLRTSPGATAETTIIREGVTIVRIGVWISPHKGRRMRFAPGAITAPRRHIPLLLGHDTNSLPAGDVTDLAETDGRAMTATITMPTDDSRTASAVARLAAGQPVPLSIGANIIAADRHEADDGWLEDTITEAHLLEVSLVGLAADPEAAILSADPTRPAPDHPLLTAAMTWITTNTRRDNARPPR